MNDRSKEGRKEWGDCVGKAYLDVVSFFDVGFSGRGVDPQHVVILALLHHLPTSDLFTPSLSSPFFITFPPPLLFPFSFPFSSHLLASFTQCFRVIFHTGLAHTRLKALEVQNKVLSRYKVFRFSLTSLTFNNLTCDTSC